MARLRMAVIGVGHLGKEHARILAGLPEVDLVGVADVNAEQAQAVARRWQTQAYGDYWPLLNLVDAACIVVPTSHHAAVAGDFLRRGIPVLIEKPLAPSRGEADALVELADHHGALIQVGHIERFNPAFEALLRRPLQAKYVRCERLGPFTGRSGDIGVVLDLMIHDLDLLLAVVQSPVVSVDALGVRMFGTHEDAANARLHFANGCVADLTASRAHPVPHRRMHLWGPEGYAGIDFAKKRLSLTQPSDELRRCGIDPSKLDAASRARLKDDLFDRYFESLDLDHPGQDQLTAELKEFVHCVKTGSRPRIGGHEARDAIALAEQILASLRSHSWTGEANGPCGPTNLPAPVGPLFQPFGEEEQVA